MGGPEGIVESIQIMKEGKASASEAVDCKWYIRAPPRSKVSLKVKTDLTVSLGSVWSMHCFEPMDTLSGFQSVIVSFILFWFETQLVLPHPRKFSMS